MAHDLTIDGERLWRSLMEMSEIGATEKGGVNRQALSPLDGQARDLFVQWCKDAGCTVKIDELGNIFARREGRNPARLPIATGSHLDTQPTGGKFDGAYGVMAGLEVMRTLHDANYVTDAPLELVMWTNEEGSRFAPTMGASGVFAGAYDKDMILSRYDDEGIRFSEALKAIGYDGPNRVGDHAFAAFIEAHIEQGPILEQDGKTIGVVTLAQGMFCYDISVTGQESHAGTTPMDRRQDALLAASHIVCSVPEIAKRQGVDGRGTVGALNVQPNSRNTIAGTVAFTVDLRHPQAEALAQMDAQLRAKCADVADDFGVDVKIDQISADPPKPFDTECLSAVRAAADKLGYSHRDMVSGAGHDACHISTIVPTAMIFIPCKDGISHNEIESATPEDCNRGCKVLLNTLVALADRTGIIA